MRISYLLPPSITSKLEGAFHSRPIVHFGDRLSSMASTGKEFGGLLKALFSAALSSLFENVFKEEAVKPDKNYDLADTEQLRKAFSEEPTWVIESLLDILKDDFASAKTILLNVARDWKQNPHLYLDYDKDNSQSRMETVRIFDDLFQVLVLTPSELKLSQKLEDLELSNAEISALQRKDEEWENCKEKTEKLSQMRKDVKTLNENKKLAQKLIDPIYANLLMEQDLKLESQAEHLNKEKEMTFGHMIERILSFRSIMSLRSDASYAESLGLIYKILDGYDDRFLTKFPIAKPIIEKLKIVLTTKEAEIKDLVLELIDIAKPPTQRSPPRIF